MVGNAANAVDRVADEVNGQSLAYGEA